MMEIRAMKPMVLPSGEVFRCVPDLKPEAAFVLGIGQRAMRPFAERDAFGAFENALDGSLQGASGEQGREYLPGAFAARVAAGAQPQSMARQSCGAKQCAQPLAVP
jgi:hypothetical protein